MGSGEKLWLSSKTIWVNIALPVLTQIYPPFGEWAMQNHEDYMTLVAVINVVLRWLTEDRLVIR